MNTTANGNLPFRNDEMERLSVEETPPLWISKCLYGAFNRGQIGPEYEWCVKGYAKMLKKGKHWPKVEGPALDLYRSLCVDPNDGHAVLIDDNDNETGREMALNRAEF